jgi:PAS domain S-box-containing protein
MELQETRASLEILLSISRELASSLDLHTVLSRVLTISTKNMGAERASLVVLDETAKPVDATIIYDGKLMPNTVHQLQDVATDGLAGWVIRNRKSVLVSNTSQDPRWLVRTSETGQTSEPKSALCVPLMAQEQLVGVLTIVHPGENFFTPADLALQQAIADLSGLAIRNAQLYEYSEAIHNRYHELFEDNIDPILITDLDGHILEVNHKAVLVSEYSEDELLRMSITDLHEIKREMTGEGFDRIPLMGTVSYESLLHCANRPNLPIEVYVSKVTTLGNPFIQWILRDIEVRKDLDTLRNDLTAMIYHDLRSPLANIISSLEILSTLLPMEDGSAMKSVYQLARRSTDRMQRLINSLLDINHIEAGQQITEKTFVQVSDLVAEAIEATLPNIESKSQTVEKSLAAGLPELHVDEDMIKRVLINLIENASKYSPSRSHIQISADQIDGFVRFTVDDNGPGIPEGFKEHIFDKFSRVNSVSNRKGLGIGLAFCRLAVTAHGGKIWVEDLPEGGSRFVFTIPAE